MTNQRKPDQFFRTYWEESINTRTTLDLYMLSAWALRRHKLTRPSEAPPSQVCVCVQMLCQALYSGLAFLAAAGCCLVSTTGLIQGPMCLYNTSSGLTWGVPLKPVPGRWGRTWRGGLDGSSSHFDSCCSMSAYLQVLGISAQSDSVVWCLSGAEVCGPMEHGSV